MANLLQISAQRRIRSGGNALIENVFTLLPTLALIFFMTDMGLALFKWSTLQNAVREGARYAITFQTTTVGGVALGQDASISAKVAEYAMNLVTTTDSPQHIFVNYYATSAVNTAIAEPNGNVPGNLVEVSIQNVGLTWLAPLSGSFGASIPFYVTTTPVSLTVRSSDILGGYPVGVNSVAR